MTSLNLRLSRACLVVGIILGGIWPASALQELPRPVSPPRGAPGGSISGRVVLPSGHPINSGVRIRLSSPEDPGPIVYTDNNGAFSFNNLSEGAYTIEALADRKLYEPVSETVRLIRSSRVSILIYLKEKEKTSNPVGNVVSAAEIDQKVPVPAKKEYERAITLLKEGRIDGAIACLKQALAIYPDFIAARNDLGVQYLKLNRLAEASEQFEVAIGIAPKAYNPQLNLGIVLLKEKRYADAIESLDKAIGIDSSKPAPHLYLGIASLETDDLARAQRELTLAKSLGGQDFAVAHFYMARVLMNRGEREESIRELMAFLETSPTGAEAARARQLLETLRR